LDFHIELYRAAIKEISMRSALIAVSIIAGITPVAFGQSAPYMATVTETVANLRAGPSEQFPITSALKPGDTLLVDHEEPNGWLATQDTPGKMYSLSWVQMSLVEFDKTKPTPQNVTVSGDAELAVGQLGSAEPMVDWRRTKIPAGSILTVIGPKVSAGGKWWFPVAPPSGDFRFIPKQLVRSDKQVNTSFTIRSSPDTPLAGATPPPVVTPAVSTIPAPPVAVIPASNNLPPTIPVVGPPVVVATTAPAKPVVQNPLLAPAEQAEQEGRLKDAEKLYWELARKMNEPGGDHDIANLCYTRIHSIHEKTRTAPNPTNSPRTVLTDSTQAKSSAVSATVNTRPDFMGTGRLSRSALDINAQFTYVLDGSPGVPLFYVVEAPGIDLKRYIGKQVTIYGSSSTRKDLSKPLVVATSAEMAQ
jgi:hypothetical protein